MDSTKSKSVERRTFLKWAGLSAGGACVLPSVGCATDPGDTSVDPARLPTGAGKFDHQCVATGSDVLGPYYVDANMVEESLSIADANESGQRLFIYGQVFGADCHTALPGALVEVWQANEAGEYDLNGDVQSPEDLFLRGKMTSREDGFYIFETIFPGPYRLQPDRPEHRTPHIHFKVSFRDQELVTQLYFQANPLVTEHVNEFSGFDMNRLNNEDLFAPDAETQRFANLTRYDETRWLGRFDINLNVRT